MSDEFRMSKDALDVNENYKENELVFREHAENMPNEERLIKLEDEEMNKDELNYFRDKKFYNDKTIDEKKLQDESLKRDLNRDYGNVQRRKSSLS